jgi:hypothetical protein
VNQKHRTRLTAVLLTGLVLGACRSSERDKSSDQPQSFARAFEVYETRRGSDDTEQPDWTLVDYDSDILVRPDRVLIAEAITTDPAPAPGVTADAVSLRVAAIEEQLAEIDGLDRTLRLIAEYERESADFFTNDFDEGRILSDDASWKKVLDKELQVIEHLATVAEVFVSQTEYDGRRPDRDALQFGPDDVVPEDVETDVLAYQDAVSAVYDRMAPPTNAGAVDEFGLDVPAERDTFDPAEVTRVVNETTALLRDRITELEVAVLKRAPKADVEMEAALLRGSERLPVSIAPYFLVEGVGRGDKPARIGIPSKADIARVQKGYEAYGELSDSINELAKIAGDKEKRKEFRDAALDALETFAKDLAEGQIGRAHV